MTSSSQRVSRCGCCVVYVVVAVAVVDDLELAACGQVESLQREAEEAELRELEAADANEAENLARDDAARTAEAVLRAEREADAASAALKASALHVTHLLTYWLACLLT